MLSIKLYSPIELVKRVKLKRLFFAVLTVTFIEALTYIPLYIDAFGQKAVPVDWVGFLLFEAAYILMFSVSIFCLPLKTKGAMHAPFVAQFPSLRKFFSIRSLR